MDDIANLLQQKCPNEPPEIAAIKQYALDHHGFAVRVSISQLGYSITVPSGAAATTLRMDQPNMRTTCNLEPSKKIFIRIGQL